MYVHVDVISSDLSIFYCLAMFWVLDGSRPQRAHKSASLVCNCSDEFPFGKDVVGLIIKVVISVSVGRRRFANSLL